MEFTAGTEGHEDDIVGLFSDVFTASEGAQEGKAIGLLARDLIASTPAGDLYVFTAREAGRILGSILFSRLSFDQDDRTVFLLAPVAVATGAQGQGIGQRLIDHGLAALRDDGVDIAITYGDPRYYSKVGFMPIDEAFAAAPFPLSQPHGWQARLLAGDSLSPLQGRSTSVAAFNDPQFW